MLPRCLQTRLLKAVDLACACRQLPCAPCECQPLASHWLPCCWLNSRQHCRVCGPGGSGSQTTCRGWLRRESSFSLPCLHPSFMKKPISSAGFEDKYNNIWQQQRQQGVMGAAGWQAWYSLSGGSAACCRADLPIKSSIATALHTVKQVLQVDMMRCKLSHLKFLQRDKKHGTISVAGGSECACCVNVDHVCTSRLNNHTTSVPGIKAEPDLSPAYCSAMTSTQFTVTQCRTA